MNSNSRNIKVMKERFAWRTHLIYLLLICFFLAFALKLFAAPLGGVVEYGNANISSGNNITTIDQGSNSAIINWDSFNIGSNEAVRFNQPNTSAITLNRITSGNISEIYGSLSANGNIFLVNTAGILIGRGASIDVGGLLLSTANIRSEDFLNGNYSFNDAKGIIQNLGNIRVRNGSYSIMLGKSIENSGIIASKFSKVALASGDSFKVDLVGNNLISVAVTKDILDANIINKGVIENEAGTIFMQAGSVNNIMRSAINNEGLIDATSIEYAGGMVVLKGGNIQNSGDILANGAAGGSIKIDASSIKLLNNSLLSANGIVRKGGNIQVVARDSLEASKQALVRAESIYANGGVVELSGKVVSLKNTVSTKSKYASSGIFLIDPTDVVIGNFPGTTGVGGSQVDASWLSEQLNSNNMIVQADNSIQLNSDSAILSNGVGNLTLNAGSKIMLQGDISLAANFTLISPTILSNTHNIIAAKNLNITSDSLTLYNVNIAESVFLSGTSNTSNPKFDIRSTYSPLVIDLASNRSTNINLLDIEAPTAVTILNLNAATFDHLRVLTDGDFTFKQVEGENSFLAKTLLQIYASRIVPTVDGMPIRLNSKSVLAHIYNQGSQIYINAESADIGGNTHAILENTDTLLTDLDYDGNAVSGGNIKIEAPIYAGEEVINYNNIKIDSNLTADDLTIVAKNIHFERDNKNLKLVNGKVGTISLLATDSITGNANLSGNALYLSAKDIGGKYKELINGAVVTKSSAILLYPIYYAGLSGQNINVFTDNYLKAIETFEFVKLGNGEFNARLNSVSIDSSLYGRFQNAKRIGLLPAETLNTNRVNGDDLIRLVKSKTEPTIDKTPIIAGGKGDYPKAKALVFKNKRIEVR